MLNARQKEFFKLMDRMVAVEGYRQWEAFGAFLDLGAHALANPTLHGDAWQKNEDAYMAQIGRFRHANESAGLCRDALGIVVDALEDEDQDFLGGIFMECAGNPHAGQFFTPYCLSLTMAKMTFGDELKAKADAGEIITISEPACGAGSMVIAAAQALKELGIDPARQAHFTLVDVDARCVKAAYIQTTLLGISADVIHGNSLSLETWGHFRTITAVNRLMVIGDYHRAFCAKFCRSDVSAVNLHSLRKRKGWKTGRTGCFVKGGTPANKGKKCPPGKGGRHRNARRTQFKKGNLPRNTKYLGHERVSKDGYVEISIAETNPHTGFERRYVLKHRWQWEQQHGPVPDGMVLKCKGDRLNTDPSNWMLLPRAVRPRLNGGPHKQKLAYDAVPEEVRPTILAVALLDHKIRHNARDTN